MAYRRAIQRFDNFLGMSYFVSGSGPIATIGRKVAMVEDALRRACNMIGDKMISAAIRYHPGNMIDEDDLHACIDGEKVLSNNLQRTARAGLPGNALLRLSCLDNQGCEGRIRWAIRHHPFLARSLSSQQLQHRAPSKGLSCRRERVPRIV